MRPAPVALSLVICLGGAACGPDLPGRLWRSEHVRYFTRAGDDSACPDLLGQVEEHAQVIGDALGIERPLVTYYKYPNAVDFQQNAECGAGASACARNAAVSSTNAFDRHELIHAYLAPYGLPPRLFIEGAAVALSCQHYPRPTGSWRDALTADRFSPQLYGAGGWLVGYLMRMFRKTWFVNLYGSLQINATADEIDAVFRRIYDMSLDDVWAAAIGGRQAPVLCPWECGRPAVDADGQPHPILPVCGDGAAQLTANVSGGGVTRWQFDGDGYFSIGSCEGNDHPLHVVAGNGGTGAMLAPLVSGKYFIDTVVNARGTATLSLDTNALPALSSFDCASAPAVPDDLARYQTLTLFFPSSVGSQFTTFAQGNDHLGVLSLASDNPSATGSMCNSCDPQSCTNSSIGGGLGTDVQTGAVLSIPSGSAVTANFSWISAGPPAGADGGL
jgi:hypothetical protein